MIRRLLLLLFGLGAGAAIGVLIMRRLDRAARSVAPGALAGQAREAATTFGARLRAAWDETRLAAAEHETELRSRFDVPTAAELLRRG